MKKFLVVSLLFLFSLSLSAQEKEWTVVVYLNADNNLCKTYSKNDIKEMKTSDASKNANWVVIYDCDAKNDSYIFSLEGNKETKLDFGYPKEFDMGDYNFFVDSVDKVFTKFPSQKKMVIIWNHGSGWENLTGDTKGVSYDDGSGNHITTLQMGTAMAALSQKHHIDILGYDACDMQMLEVIYETAKYHDYTIASEPSEPGDGWEYKSIMKKLTEEGVSPEELGKVIVNGYIDFYLSNQSQDEDYISGKVNFVHLSLVKNSAFLKLTEEIKNLIPQLKTFPDIKNAISNATEVEYGNADFGSFLSYLPEEMKSPVLSAYKDAVILSRTDIPNDVSGIAVYLPSSDFSSGYLNLNFSKDIGWGEFLQSVSN